jgi:hypothetical protein
MRIKRIEIKLLVIFLLFTNFSFSIIQSTIDDKCEFDNDSISFRLLNVNIYQYPIDSSYIKFSCPLLVTSWNPQQKNKYEHFNLRDSSIKSKSDLLFLTSSKKTNLFEVKHYQRISNSSNAHISFGSSKSDGYYAKNEFKETSLQIGMDNWLNEKKLNYSFDYIYLSQRKNESGGINDDSIFINYVQNPKFYKTNLLSSYSRTKLNELDFNFRYTIYNFKSQSGDSNRIIEKSKLFFLTQFSVANNSYRFISNDRESYYEHFYIDSLRTNDVLRSNPFVVTTGLILDKINLNNNISLRGEVNIKHTRENITQNEIDSMIINTDFRSHFQLINQKESKWIELYFESKRFQRIKQYNHENLRIKASFDLLKVFILQTGWSYENLTPSFSDNFYFSNNFKWENNFDLTNIREIFGNIAMKNSKLSLGYANYSIKKFIYYDEKGAPNQFNESIQLSNIVVTSKLHLGNLSLFNFISSNLTNENKIMRIPNTVFQSKLSYLHRLKKKGLSIEPIVLVNFWGKTLGKSYEPSTRSFYFKEGYKKTGNYMFIDASVRFNIKRAYLQIGSNHLNAGLMGRNYFLTSYYPYPGRSIYFKIVWTLIN